LSSCMIFEHLHHPGADLRSGASGGRSQQVHKWTMPFP
jgi:hypothetical protein